MKEKIIDKYTQEFMLEEDQDFLAKLIIFLNHLTINIVEGCFNNIALEGKIVKLMTDLRISLFQLDLDINQNKKALKNFYLIELTYFEISNWFRVRNEKLVEVKYLKGPRYKNTGKIEYSDNEVLIVLVELIKYCSKKNIFFHITIENRVDRLLTNLIKNLEVNLDEPIEEKTELTQEVQDGTS